VIAELERAEAEAFASFFESAELPVLRVGDAVCFAAPGVSDMQLNRVVALGVSQPVSDAELDEIADFYRAAGTRYAVSTADPALAERLVARGYAPGYAWMKFARDGAPAAAETTLRVEETTDPLEFGRVVSTVFGLPETASFFGGIVGREGWTMLVARDGSEAVAAAAVFVHDGVGWLGIAGTLPAHRGKGAQNALLAARIERGRELGAHAFTTETGERQGSRPNGSYRNILRAGFAEAYLRPNLLSPE
jgi:GNAT superfamily N-acetyltransferase